MYYGCFSGYFFYPLLINLVMKKLLLVAACIATAATASADWYLCGASIKLNEDDQFVSNWEDNASFKMTQSAENANEFSIQVAAIQTSLKIKEDGTWSTSLGRLGTSSLIEGTTYQCQTNGPDINFDGTIENATITANISNKTILIKGNSKGNEYDTVYLIGDIAGAGWNANLTAYPLPLKEGTDNVFEGIITLPEGESYFRLKAGTDEYGPDIDQLFMNIGYSDNAELGSSLAYKCFGGEYLISFTVENGAETGVLVFSAVPEPEPEVQPLEVNFIFNGENNNIASFEPAIPANASDWTQDTSAKDNSKYTVGEDGKADIAYIKLNGITITSKKNTDTAALPCLYAVNKEENNVTFRAYKNNTITVSAPEGFLVKNLEFVTNTTSASDKFTFTTNVADQTGTNTADSSTNKNLTWSAPDANITDVNFSVSATVQIKELKVTLEANTTVGVETTMIETGTTPIFYNMQGVKVSNPSNGLYIRVDGKKTQKVVVR